jgi:sensor histidine kinase YesM
MNINFVKNQGTQILVHLLFWTLFVFVSLFVFSKYYWEENPFLQYVVILVLLVYGNNQIVLPFFVRKKWYVLYTFVFVLISFLATKLYCDVFAQCGCSIKKCLSDYLWQTLTPLIFFSFIWILFRYKEKQDEVEKVKQEHVKMELQFLKSQINPHVLFNNLNTIYSYSLEKPNETPDLILKLSDNLKHVLYESNADKISLSKELSFIDNYIDFQKIRTEGTKQIHYTKNIDTETYTIAPLLLITLIENAYKYSKVNSIITVNIKAEKGILECICKNAYDKNQHTLKKGIGLKNLKKRLNLLYKGNYELQIKEESEFIAYLKIALL